MRWSGILALIALAACDGPAPGVDGGAPEPDAGGPFVEPAAPAPPVFAPCPDGWSAAPSGEGFDVCEPPPDVACPEGEVRFVDETSCGPIGAACPAGDWAEPPAGVTALYVRAGASGGDGSMAAPYGTIRDAIVRAPPGAAILLAKGTYAEAIDVFGGLRVIGACAAETFLAPETGGAVVRVAELGVVVEDVTLRPGAGLRGVEVTGELTLRAVRVEGATDDAVFVFEGGALEASRLVVRDARASMPLFGRGLTVTDGAATVAQALFDGCPGSGVLVSRGGRVSARAIRVTQSGEGIQGRPLVIAQGEGGELTLAESLLEGGAGTGVLVSEAGTLEVDQVVIRDLFVDPAMPSASAGIFARTAGRVEARRLRIERTELLGAGLAEGSEGTFEDTYVARVGAAALDGQPVAMGILYSGPSLVVRRMAIRDIDRMGVQVERGTLVLEDVSIARTGDGPGTGYVPMGYAQLEGETTLRRVRVEATRGAAIFAEATTVTLEDVAVVEPPGLADGRFGRGIELSRGAATLTRVRVEGARELGVQAQRGATVEAAGLRVVDTRGRDCRDTTCPDTPGGLGIVVVDAALTARDFTIDGARLCGVMVAGGEGALDLRGGAIRAATVGACVQVDGYDVARLTDGVEFRDNGVNLDATDHAAPTPSDPLGGLDL